MNISSIERGSQSFGANVLDVYTVQQHFHPHCYISIGKFQALISITLLHIIMHTSCQDQSRRSPQQTVGLPIEINIYGAILKEDVKLIASLNEYTAVSNCRILKKCCYLNMIFMVFEKDWQFTQNWKLNHQSIYTISNYLYLLYCCTWQKWYLMGSILDNILSIKFENIINVYENILHTYQKRTINQGVVVLSQQMKQQLVQSIIQYNNYNFILMRRAHKRSIDFPEQSEDFLNNEPYSPMQNPSSGIHTSTPLILQKYNHQNQFEYMNLYQILQKFHSGRTHNELKFIHEFIKKNTALKQLAEINGIQFCKGIMRAATIEDYSELDIVKHKGNPIDSVYIVLEGKLASIKNQDYTDMIEHIKQRQVYELLMNLSRKQTKKIRKIMRKFSIQRDNSNPKRAKYENIMGKQFLEYFQKGQTCGDKLKCFSNEESHTVIALQYSLLLSINVKNLFFWLNHAYQLKLQKTYKILKNHPCFCNLQNEVIEEIIGFMSVYKKRKNDIIYEQNSQATHIYFLEQGELKMEKQFNLIVDNPNQLYMDRRRLMNQREILNKEYLPYANFEQLYNFRHTKKVVELGILTPFCIFGEEEMIENKRREITIKCSSFKAIYYGIEVKKLNEVVGQKRAIFLSQIQAFIKQKIKYRQNTFATAINLQNKNNLKYFYVEENQQKFTPRKYKIKKINDKININENRSASKGFSVNVGQTDLRQFNNSQINPQLQQYKKHIPPFYTTFNFHKMMKSKQTSHWATINVVGDEEDQEEAGLSKIQLNQNMAKQSNQKQFDIINNSHTWRLVKEKVQTENKLSRKIGSYTHNINFTSPLIDDKYFHHIETEMKRLQREKRAGKFNVSTPKKSKTISFHTLKSTR